MADSDNPQNSEVVRYIFYMIQKLKRDAIHITAIKLLYGSGGSNVVLYAIAFLQ